MKKAVNILTLLSVISLILFIFINIYISINRDLNTEFITDWVLIPLVILAFPTLRIFPLALNKDNIPPQIWLGIYAVIFIVLIYILVFR